MNPIEEQEFYRKNGFQRPYHILQVFSWLVFFMQFAQVYLLHVPIMNMHWKLITLVMHSIFGLFAIYYGARATAADPTDPSVYKEREHLKMNQKYVPENDYFCIICNAHVQERSKHCGQCNRCSAKFDHHCKWLNNCIGFNNYLHFQKLLISLIFMLIFKMIITVFLVKSYFEDEPWFARNISDGYKNANPKVLCVFLILFGIIDPFIAFILIELFLYHRWLKYKGMSTYEHILSRRIAKNKKSIINTAQNSNAPVMILFNRTKAQTEDMVAALPKVPAEFKSNQALPKDINYRQISSTRFKKIGSSTFLPFVMKPKKDRIL